MRIVVVGPGALGCLMAASIAVKSNFLADVKTENELWLLDHDKERAHVIADKGLLLEEDGKQFHCSVRSTADPADIGNADLMFLCVKSQDVQNGLSSAACLLASDSLLITLQNGIGHLSFLEEQSLDVSIAIGVTAQGATLVGPGHVRHAGSGPTRIGFIKPGAQTAASKLAKAASLLAEADIQTDIVDNILDHVWTKLLVNVGINALTAILGCANGKILDSASARSQLTDAVREAEAVARAKGIHLAEDPVAMTYNVCKATSNNTSSMLQDVRKKRPTEIDSINGAVVKEGRFLGVQAPMNEKLVRSIKEIERSYC